MSFKHGFITPPWAHERGDSIRAASLVRRIEKNAHHGCGLYYEIYHYRVISQLLGITEGLSPSDAETLIQAASTCGFSLDNHAVQESYQCYHDTLAEIRQHQE